MSSTGFQVPAIYRLFFLTIEPACHLMGAYLAYFRPAEYLRLTHAASAPIGDEVPLATKVVLYQVADLCMFFAVCQALVLRSSVDLRVWRALLFAILISDVGYILSFTPLGLDILWDAKKWTSLHVGAIVFGYFGASLRLSFLAGIGMPLENRRMPSSPSKRG